MINHTLNYMLNMANRANLNAGKPHLGVISSVNPVDYTVKVILQPEEVETGFIPLATQFYGWQTPPVGGEQCMVLFDVEDRNAPIAAFLLYWNNGRPPGQANSGEILLRHSSGSLIKLSNDGKITINGNTEIDVTTPVFNITTTGNATITVGGNLTATATGNTTISGNNVAVTGNSISLSNGGATQALTFFSELKTIFDNHVHTDPQGGNTGTPTTTLPASASTTVIQGA